MAIIQIPNLPAVIGLDGSELFEGVQAGTSVKISLAQMIAATRSGLPTTLPIPVSLGGTGVTTLTGYVKGSGTSPFTASPTIPNTDITGLGTMSTQNANAVAITGGTAALTGASSVTANSASAAFTVTQTGAGNAFVVEDSTSPDSTPFVVTATGNVGIGATAPAVKLEVSGQLRLQGNSGDPNYYTTFTNAYGGDGSFTLSQFYTGYGEKTVLKYIPGASPNLGLYTNGVERMRIDASGNVGIGAASPSLKLDVRGGSIVAGLGGMVLYGRLDAGFPSAAFNTGYFALGTNNTDASNGGLSIYTMAASTLSERMRITSGGNVGIGTTSPSAWVSTSKAVQLPGISLESTSATAGNIFANAYRDSSYVRRYVNTGTANQFDMSSSGFRWFNAPSGTAGDAVTFTQHMTLDASGNLGIGTTTGLTKKLNLASDATSAAATRMTNSANTLGFEVGLLAGDADASAYIYQRANSVMFFGTNNLTRMTIDNSGNVGIGATANTSSILDAQSTTKGVRFPNMTTTQKNAIANVAGNVVFDTTLGKLCVNTGAGWQTITSA